MAKLTETRIDAVAKKIVDALDENDLIRTTAVHRKEIYRKISRIIFEDQQIESDIEQEAISVMEPLTKKYAPGSPQWEAMYMQTKERIAAKKNFEF